jgi:hypothetical protein
MTASPTGLRILAMFRVVRSMELASLSIGALGRQSATPSLNRR